ncbi:MAG: tetratricopeptide repeat protein [Myxococcota bacterium]
MDLDARMDALRHAVEAKNGDAIADQLQAIDTALETETPLVRATTYAHVQQQLGRPLDAAAVLEDLLSVAGDHAATYYQLGCYRRDGGQTARALEAFQRAASIDPMMVDAWMALGTMLDDQGQAEQAVVSYRSGMLADPTDVGVWRNLGNSLAALGHFSESVSAYDTALGLLPNDLTLVVLRASAFQAQGEIERANASIPTTLRSQIGVVVEVRLDGADQDLRCRFHTDPQYVDRSRQAAAALLAEAKADLADELPRRCGDGFLARCGETVLLCDPDPRRDGLPTRFFDATGLVRAQR